VYGHRTGGVGKGQDEGIEVEEDEMGDMVQYVVEGIHGAHAGAEAATRRRKGGASGPDGEALGSRIRKGALEKKVTLLCMSRLEASPV
jgi:hypothetical protein